MAMTWKLGLLNLSPRLLNFHNPDRVFSDKPSLDSPSGEPPLIPPPRSFSLSSLIQAKLPKFSGFGETGETGREERGPFSNYLHQSRLNSIREKLCRHFRRDPLSARPFKGLKFIAVGCGGGILSESLAQLGATVTGIDAVEEKIKKARLHAELDPVTSRIEYHCTTAVFDVFEYFSTFPLLKLKAGVFPLCTAKLVEEQESFDAVLALEVIQHVENPAEFCKSLSALTVSDGAIMISFTKPYFIVIIASILLDWLPNGTPQWLSFIYPNDLFLSWSVLLWFHSERCLWLSRILGDQTSLFLVPKQKRPSQDQNMRSARTRFDDS